MADYVPDTVVKVLKNVPLDDTYTDTRWFASTDEQQSFFNGKAKYTFTDMTYQRVNNSVANLRIPLSCRVPMIADNLYDCNYIMFQNTNYGSKWFYAFIRKVNYINPNNTEILYEIDYLQTFMFELRIKPSFVEREHASLAEDIPFYNLTPEPIDVQVDAEDVSQFTRLGAKAEDGYVIRLSVMPNSLIESLLVGFSAQMYNGIYSGCVCNFYSDYSRLAAIITAICAIDGGSESIVDISMCPNGSEADNKGYRAKETTIETKINYLDTNFTTTPETYAIRNKKLLNSQFTYIKARSDSGEEMIWKPELFYNQDGKLSGFANEISMPEYGYCFTPNYYMRNAGLVEYGNAEYSITFQQEVHCTWSTFGWGANLIKSGLKIAAIASTGGTLAGALNSTVNGTSVLRGMQLAGLGGQTQPDAIGQMQQVGSLLSARTEENVNTKGSGDALSYAMGLRGIEIKRMCPNSETLKKLDMYFDMFGYQVNKVKMPNLNTRQSWNYVKLNTPCIYGSVPVEGMEIIKRAFSNGIRLWHVDAVGDYSVENPAL